MSDGTLIIDTSLDYDGLQEDLDTLQTTLEKAAEGMAEEIAETGKDLGKTMGEKAGEALSSAVEAVLENGELEASGQKMGQALGEGLADAVDQDLGKELGGEVQEGLENILDKSTGEDIGEEVSGGLTKEVDRDLGEDIGEDVQKGLERTLDKDSGEEIGEELGGGISGGVEKGAGKIGDIFKKIVSSEAFHALAQFTVAFVKGGIENATELEKEQKRVNTIFGDGAEQVSAFADGAKNAFGVGKINARQYAGDVGASLKKLGVNEKYIASMSTSVVGLSGDMASAFGSDQTDTMADLQEAVEGNTGALDAYGISMSTASLEAYAVAKGLNKSYKSMDDAEKATLRYAYIMDQTSGIQGHFASNSGDFSNQLTAIQLNISHLATSIGEKVLPVINWALEGLNNIFEGTGKTGLSSEVQEAITTLGNVKTNISDIKENYAKEVIKIQVQYETSINLLDEYEKLADKQVLTAEDLQRMQDITKALRKGAKGEYVRTLQNLLLAAGQQLPRFGADGDFGAETEAAVRAFQAANGLAVDGIVGARTWTALLESGEIEDKVDDDRYTVTIPNLTQDQADALMAQWPGAAIA